MKQLTILVDMDDTIELLMDAWLKWLNSKFHRNVQLADVTNWDVSLAFPGLTHEQVYDILLEDDFWDTVQPMPGAPEALKSFQDQGHTIYIVTVNPYQTVRAKMEKVLFRYFPFLDWQHVIITSNKTMLKADVLIDDGVHNLENGDYAKILVDGPYNHDYNAESAGMKRVYNWGEIVAEVNRIAETHPD